MGGEKEKRSVEQMRPSERLKDSGEQRGDEPTRGKSMTIRRDKEKGRHELPQMRKGVRNKEEKELSSEGGRATFREEAKSKEARLQIHILIHSSVCVVQ